mmetsp:Transcript_908/g.880  ORF Transcript_908/g.880 Transcript_908/m.880 type:complete len:600 (-) Transcript_908:113-1912(-)
MAVEMADNPLRILFGGNPHDEEFNHSPATNHAMVQELARSAALRSPDCIAAFHAADRRHFWLSGGGGSPELVYADMPLRTGRLHLSAPHIYAKALESLMPLQAGMSFLNVGSGTGYFNSIVGELIGNQATNHGIDIWPETVAHARERCRLRGTRNIEFTVGNVYQLDVNHTMRYDRIYLGACANSRSKYLYRLLEVGGVLIGPFQAGHTQQLRRVVRHTETQFNVEVLGSVQFACLVEPAPTLPPPEPVSTIAMPTEVAIRATHMAVPISRRVSVGSVVGAGSTTDADGSSQSMGLPDVPFNFALSERPWTPERCWLYPVAYKRVVSMSLRCRPRNHTTPCLPTEIWVRHIFPWCPRWWFEPPRPATPLIGPQSSPLGARAALSPTVGPSPSPGVPLLMALPPCCKSGGSDAENDTDLSDDGGSTRAPSSGQSSAQTTPESGPSAPPSGVEADETEIGVSTEEASALDLDDVLFEVFSNGQRHAIGADGDPDDMEPDEPFRLVVPLHVLQLLAADNRHRRMREAAENYPGGDEGDEDEEEAESEDEDDEMLMEQDYEDEDNADAEMTIASEDVARTPTATDPAEADLTSAEAAMETEVG